MNSTRKILFVCSLGMSSAIAVKALEKEAESAGYDLQIKAIGVAMLESELESEKYDLIMTAPQIKNRAPMLKKIADEFSVKMTQIEARGYGPLGGPILLKQVIELCV